MTRSLRQLLISYLIGLAYISAAYGQASLLPQPNQQFLDNNGNPLSAGKVYTYQTDGVTPKTTWRDAGETMTNTNPITLDSGGRAIVYGTGSYSLVVQDSNGVQIYQGVTTAPLTSGGGTVSDGTPLATILPYSGLTVPSSSYVFAYGQAISRTTYATYLAAVTQTSSGVCVSGNATMSGFADTTQIPVSGAVESTCFAPGATVASKTSTTVTMSSNATVSTTANATFFLYGNGDGATTFNVPDLRGRAPIGRDNMGGTAAATLTSTFYGTNPDATGASGGTQSKTIAQANLPNVSFTVSGITLSDPGHTHSYNGPTGAQAQAVGAVSAGSVGATTGSSTTGITIATQGTAASGGSGTAISLVQPSLTVNYIVKIQ